MGTAVEGDEQRPRFQVVIDLTNSHVEAVGTMRPQDGPLLHDAMVDVLLTRPHQLTVVLTRCDQYAPSLLGILLRGAKLARAVGASFVVDGSDVLRNDISRRHIKGFGEANIDLSPT